MKRLMLANVDYKQHMTDEGDQLQEGMKHAGWQLTGAGYDGLRNVPEILRTYSPDVVFVHDKRDWDAANPGCFRKGINYTELHALREYPAFRLGVVKDAGSVIDYHRRFIEEIGADAVVTYYHDETTKKLSPWLMSYPTIRTYHSVDAPLCKAYCATNRDNRKGAIVSGAVSDVYPLRQRIIKYAKVIGCVVLNHPGYGNAGSSTPHYLRNIGTYKVSLATASSYGFALRKIIEAVAMATIPITDLPEWDCLPQIDGALVRVSPSISVEELRDLVADKIATWDFEERLEWARKAWAFYDWRFIGLRLDMMIEEAAKAQWEKVHL
jgi:hypothetical protein